MSIALGRKWTRLSKTSEHVDLQLFDPSIDSIDAARASIVTTSTNRPLSPTSPIPRASSPIGTNPRRAGT